MNADFNQTLKNFEKIISDRDLGEQNVVTMNRYGVFITINEITVNYSTYYLQDMTAEYLTEQKQAHEKYLSILFKANQAVAQIYEVLSPKPIISKLIWKALGKKTIDGRIKNMDLIIARDKVLNSGALLGKHFLKSFPEYITEDENKYEAIRNYYINTEKSKTDYASLLDLTEMIHRQTEVLLDLDQKTETLLKQLKGLYFNKLK